jgi:hypothetical protein
MSFVTYRVRDLGMQYPGVRHIHVNRTAPSWQVTTFTMIIFFGNTISFLQGMLCILTCICLRRRLFHVTLEILHTVISWHHSGGINRYWYVRVTYARVVAGSGMGGGIRKIKSIRWGAYYYSLVVNTQPCKYDMYKSSLRHIHDQVLSSLKIKGIHLLFF